ncbi:protein G12-like [Anopheles marshallii]|uniref:protein G12-like n=1 Tax=Anopheles marshallii TaxID=1521116 RepID=UPI00237BE674|nr:protein G12-like [Anopheles marshallii]
MLKLDMFALMVVSVSASVLTEHSNSLLRDLQDFVDLLDLDRVIHLTNTYYLNDQDFQSMLEYMQSGEFSVVWNGFFGLAVIRDLGMYLIQEGVPFYDYVDLVAYFIGQSPVNSRLEQHINKTQHRSLKAYVDELFAMLPWSEWRNLYEVKQTSSEPFKSLIIKLRSVNYTELKQFYQNTKELRSFIHVLRCLGLDVELYEHYLMQFFHGLKLI